LAATFEATEKVTVVVLPPGAGTTLAGSTCAVMPDGNPETASVIAELKVEFGAVVMVKLFEAPGARLIDVLEGVRVNVGAGAIVTERETVCFIDPAAAVTVTEETPALAAEVAVSLSTLLPEPGAGSVAGVNAAVTPAGNPLNEHATGALKPPLTATSRVSLLFDPAVTEREPAVGVT
jgi:hypothetical protein